MFTQFFDYVAEINDLLCTINILNWDANTNMPLDGATVRGKQVATLVKLTQEKLTAPALGELIARAEDELAGTDRADYRVCMVAEAKRAYDIARRVPPALLAEIAAERSIAEKEWGAAKADNDFPRFAPYLEKFVTLNREMIAAIGVPAGGHPYDVMLARTEPWMTVAQLQPIFEQLKGRLKPLLDRIVTSDVKLPVELLSGDFPVDQQKRFCYQIAERLGYDMRRGHFAESPHPFEISFTRQDVRITNRYQPDFLAGGLFGMLHEVGHALYEQGIDPQLTRSALATDFLSQYAVGGVTFGMHEAQSRLWENQIGRSRPFWGLHYDALQACFPTALGHIDVETFYRAINHVAPSLIRVEADEVTYNFHIMLRVELEMGLLDGSITVNELPALWRSKMESGLGVVPERDSEGVLQDIHWAFGQMGTFPAYTLGNIISAQLLEGARQQVARLDEHLAAGRYAPLLDWLTENIYRHGRAYPPDQLLTSAVGAGLDTDPYLTYLETKYTDLFEL